MKTISKLFREVEFEIVKVAFLNSFLNACLVFFSLYLIMTLIDVSFTYAIIFSALFFVADFIHLRNKYGLKQVEKSNPAVQDMLRTAYDNKDEKNVLVLGLFYDLVKKMKSVSAGNMLDSNILFKKILAITVLTFVVVFLSSLEIYVGNISIPLGQFGDDLSGFFGGEPGQTKNTTLEILEFNDTAGLYGDESLAKLGSEELNLNINPSISEIDFNREKDLESKEFDTNGFPIEPSVQTSDFGGNDIPEEAELAKAYNLELKK